MSTPLIFTKLYFPPRRLKVVLRPRLIGRLNEGLVHNGRFAHKLTLISAPAGFGKTTLLGEWLAACELPVAWLSLDKGDNDPTRFLAYFVAALQQVTPGIGGGVSGALQSPQPPPVESILTSVLNEIAPRPENFVLVLDDYHVIDAKPIDHALTFLLEHLPPQMHLVLSTREDPQLPLGRLRVQEQLTELRASDLRFTLSEAAKFLNHIMGLNLPAQDIGALETRTEGWIAGLQLAALAMQGQISMQGHRDPAGFIKSFTGSHRFVVDYLVEQVLLQQPESVQNFLLSTSILDRLCGPLCDAVLGRDNALESNASSLMLESLERANLFIIPLDDKRHWYRYHHLFSELLRQRLRHSSSASTVDVPPRSPLSSGTAPGSVNELHIRASQWYEDNGFNMDAFLHAAAANDVERAERLLSGKRIPLHLSGGVIPILDWLDSLPETVLNARPWLWVTHGAHLLISGNTTGVEEKLRAGEAALQAAGLVTSDGLPVSDASIRYLVGQIASARATLALTRYDVDAMLAQSSRALEYLHSEDVPYHTALWTQGFAYFVIGNRPAARRSFTEGISVSQAHGDMFTTILTTIGLGSVQEADTELYQAAQTHRRVLELAGEHPQQIVHETHLGLARIAYEWNDLDAAGHHGEQALQLARQYDINVIDRFILCELFLARLKLARGDVSGAASLLAQIEQSARQPNFAHRLPELAAVQVLVLLRQGNLESAARLAQTYPLALTRARVHLAQGDASAALDVLEQFRVPAETMDLKDERLKVTILQALAHQARGETDRAVQLLAGALELAEPGGFIRLFIDEGAPMAHLLSEAATRGILPDYIDRLRSALNDQDALAETKDAPLSSLISSAATHPSSLIPHPLPEPLSPRELEIVRLLAQGLSNQEIAARLFLALNTVKGHNRRIYDKLQVQRRTEAIARARELGLL